MPGSLKPLLISLFNISVGRAVGTITHFSTREAVAALTFDDGPHPKFTPRLLDILEKYQARATFFVIGNMASRYPEIVQRAAQAGHAIGNHSWDHPSFVLISGRERRAQIRQCAQAVAPDGQQLFRPPHGHQNLASRLDVLWQGYEVVTWNLAVDDWLDHKATWMADQLVNRVQPGSVILLHDALNTALDERYGDREPMLEALTMMLEQLKGRFRFVTVPEMFRYGRPQRRLWYRQANIDSLNRLKKLEYEY